MPADGKHIHSEKWHRCWTDVQNKGHSESSAAAICTAALGDESFNASDSQHRDDGQPVQWEFYTLGKPFKPFKKKRPDEQKDAKPKWTPPWLKK